MSKDALADRIPHMPKAVPMPPYPYQRDTRSNGGGAVSGTKSSSGGSTPGILSGSNLCG
jgi:hypothetical protein